MVSNDSIFEELKYTQNLFKKKVINLKFSNSQSKALVKIESDDIKNKNDIENLRKSHKNLGDFLNALVKKYGMQIGKNLYKFVKNA